RAVLVTGSPGGRTIINTVLCVLVNSLEYNLPLREAVDAPRCHHAWMPDVLRVEASFWRDHPPLRDQLRGLGHSVEPAGERQGDAHSICVDPRRGTYQGVSDRRRDGWAEGY